VAKSVVSAYFGFRLRSDAQISTATVAAKQEPSIGPAQIFSVFAMFMTSCSSHLRMNSDEDEKSPHPVYPFAQTALKPLGYVTGAAKALGVCVSFLNNVFSMVRLHLSEMAIRLDKAFGGGAEPGCGSGGVRFSTGRKAFSQNQVKRVPRHRTQN